MEGVKKAYTRRKAGKRRRKKKKKMVRIADLEWADESREVRQEN